MGIINLEDIQPGMILDAEVKDRSGRLLLGAGSEITEKHLRIFKMWGVTEADIRGIEKEEIAVETAAEIDPLLLQEAEAQGRELFHHTDLEHPFIKELFRLFTLRMVRQKSGGDDHVS
ncbi:MAG: hypothetical protein HWN69_10000 [Desulfobacterales bacterium]|nr:hypothetical protein [Desulfobacterales bacterium]